MMNWKNFRPVRLASFLLAATVALTPAAMAVNENDAPVIVSSEITGTALGLGSVDVLGVNVRENPNMEAEILTSVLQGQQVLVLSKEGDWYRVSVGGVNGYIRGDYLDVTDGGSADLGYGLIKASAANIRVAPDPESDTLDCLGEEEVVTITGIENGWYKVDLNGAEGYVRSDLVDPTAEIPAEKIYDYAVIEGLAVNLRSEPNAESAKNDVLYSGSLCTLLEQDGDWYKVAYGDNVGYVYASLVSITNNAAAGSTELETMSEVLDRQAQEAAAAQAAAQAAASQPQVYYSYGDETPAYTEPAYEAPVYDEPSYSYDEPAGYDYEEPAYYEEPSYSAPASSSSGSAIVDTAMNYLGAAYVWGGTSPSGFDCSGFAQYVYAQNGEYITRTADTQYYDGSYVSYDNLEAGDLVFFAEGGEISHVGIYIGDDQFIHAANPSSGVKISDLSEDWYASRYYGASRP